MSTIKVNTLDSTTGTSITVPTGKTFVVTDTGALTIGGVAITTGAHVTATSSTNPTTITAGNVTAKSNYALVFDASSGTSTTFVVNLPAPADFATTVITVRSNAAHGSGNKIEIRNSGGTEVYTLYHVHDYCTFISDGTNTIRTGDEFVTIRGEVALTSNYTQGANAVSDLFDAVGANYSVVEEIGGGWDSTDDDWTAPFAGEFMLAGSILLDGYGTGFGLKKNGTFIQAISGAQVAYGNATWGVKPFVLAKDDVITFWVSSTNSTPIWYGNAAATSKRTTANWWCLRRY